MGKKRWTSPEVPRPPTSPPTLAARQRQQQMLSQQQQQQQTRGNSRGVSMLKGWENLYSNLGGGWVSTHLKNLSQMGYHFLKDRGEHQKYLSCHHLVTVDGWKPAPVEVGSWSHYLQGFMHPRLGRISCINSRNLTIWNTILGTNIYIYITYIYISFLRKQHIPSPGGTFGRFLFPFFLTKVGYATVVSFGG